MNHEIPVAADKELISLPSTCGTGSEVTNGGIVTMKQTGYKTGIMDETLTSKYAVLIPELIKGLPFKVFMHCSVDALGHSMESFVSATRSNPFARAAGAQSIAMILNGYADLLLRGQDYRFEIGKDFIMASCLGGLAVNNGGAGPVHALAYPLGEKYKVSHGESIYQFLTTVFDIYERENPKEGLLTELKEIISRPLEKAGFHTGQEGIFQTLEALFNKVYPSRPLSACGMTEGDIEPFVENIFQSKQRLLNASYIPFTKDMAREAFKKRL
jgi:4-hydroxybutyrate dehydrogenase